MILCRQLALPDVFLTDQLVINIPCLCKVKTSAGAVSFGVRLTLKEVGSDDDRSVATCFSHFRL